YGAPVTFSASVSALDSGEGTPSGAVQFYADGSALGSPVTLSDGAASISTATWPVGVHDVTAVYSSDSPTFGASASLAAATVTTTPAALAITANDLSRTYGSANPAFTASYSGLVLGEGASVLDGTLSFDTAATALSDVGSYAITPSGLTATNYTITFIQGTLSVTPAPL